jgi:hypothetical protein
MQQHPFSDDSNLAVFFFGAIFSLIADLDTPDIKAYAVKAVLGGIVWLIFKLASDLLTHHLKIGKRDDHE